MIYINRHISAKLIYSFFHTLKKNIKRILKNAFNKFNSWIAFVGYFTINIKMTFFPILVPVFRQSFKAIKSIKPRLRVIVKTCVGPSIKAGL